MKKEEKHSNKCPICGRPTHKESKYCIFHASAEEKTEEEFKKTLKEYIEEIKEEDGDYDFNEFIFIGEIDFKKDLNVTVFKNANFWKATFEEETSFEKVTFEGDADFRETKFKEYVTFRDATFRGRARFNNATFDLNADFRQVAFKLDVDFKLVVNFWQTNFRGNTYFKQATFDGKASFNRATFKSNTDFEQVTFEKNTDFCNATFEKDTYFKLANFKKCVDFWRVTFEDRADFEQAIFKDFADFEQATFRGNTDLKKVTFEGRARFDNATFERIANFDSANFEGETGFGRVTFKGDSSFRKTSFAEFVYFVEAIFELDAQFKETTFKEIVDFKQVIFKKDAYFGLKYLFEILDFTEIKISPGKKLSIKINNGGVNIFFRRAYLENMELEMELAKDTLIEFTSALIKNAKIKKGQIENHILQEKEKEFSKAKEIYLLLKNNFHSIGQYDDESWAFKKEKDMERKDNCHFKTLHKWFWSCFLNGIFGYGEQPGKVIISAISIILIFTFLFMSSGISSTGIGGSISKNFLDCVYFSVITFTTLGYGDFRPLEGWSRIFSGTEAFIGALMMALFVYTFARRTGGR